MYKKIYMKNYCHTELSSQTTYTESGTTFEIKANDSVLYLKQLKRPELHESFFVNQELDVFVLEDIHVSVMETYEQDNRGSKKHLFKRNSPFHITLRLSDPASQDTLIIHDFYCGLDLSRDFHLQLQRKHDGSINYLPAQSIDLLKLDVLIEKEIKLVNSLVVKNEDYHDQLTRNADNLTQELYALTAFPNPSVKEEFIQMLTELITIVEQLIDFGHQKQERRLVNLRSELDNLKAITEPKIEESEENASIAEAQIVIKKNKAKKKDKKHEKKSNPDLEQYLKNYCDINAILRARKHAFLTEINRMLETNLEFTGYQRLFDLCYSELELLESLYLEEAEEITLKFFAKFATQNNPELQRLCLQIANLYAEHMPFFRQHMRKISMTNFDLFDFKFSGLMLAYMNNNAPYWEFMHDYGISFADNRHIFYQGMAGNLLQSMLISINYCPKESLENLIPFAQRLFRYLEEDDSSLMNMKLFHRTIIANKKKTASKTVSKRTTVNISQCEVQKLKHDMLEEPYGTIVMIDAIHIWLLRSFLNTPSQHEATIMPRLVDMIELVLPHVQTEAMLNVFERLISLETIGFFDDNSFNKFSSMRLENVESNLLMTCFSDFSIRYVGKHYRDLINHLIDVLVSNIQERGQLLSNTMLSSLMHAYFEKAQTSSTRERAGSMFSDNYDFTFTVSRMAYFLFTIKLKRALFLSLNDYRVMLNFYQAVITRESSRFDESTQMYQQQLQSCLRIMKTTFAVIQRLEMPEEEKLALTNSKEYLGLKSSYEELATAPSLKRN